MAGLLVFKTLKEAMDAGFHVIDKTKNGYLLRIRTERGYKMALVNLRS